MTKMHKTAISMEQRTVTIKNFLWITDPDIHLRRIAYPSERKIGAFIQLSAIIPLQIQPL